MASYETNCHDFQPSGRDDFEIAPSVAPSDPHVAGTTHSHTPRLVRPPRCFRLVGCRRGKPQSRFETKPSSVGRSHRDSWEPQCKNALVRALTAGAQHPFPELPQSNVPRQGGFGRLLWPGRWSGWGLVASSLRVQVWYTAKGMRERNADPLKDSLRLLMRSSDHPMIRVLLGPPHDDKRGVTTVAKFFQNSLQVWRHISAKMHVIVQAVQCRVLRCVEMEAHHNKRLAQCKKAVGLCPHTWASGAAQNSSSVGAQAYVSR